MDAQPLALRTEVQMFGSFVFSSNTEQEEPERVPRSPTRLNVWIDLPSLGGNRIMLRQQARYGINLGMNYVARQGYSTPYFLGAHHGTEDALNPSGRNILLSTDIGDARLPTVHSFDARASKVLRISRLTADVDLDVFNLFNTSTILGRQFDLNATNGDQPLEIMNARVIRLGLRVRFSSPCERKLHNEAWRAGSFF